MVADHDTPHLAAATDGAANRVAARLAQRGSVPSQNGASRRRHDRFGL